MPRNNVSMSYMKWNCGLWKGNKFSIPISNVHGIWFNKSLFHSLLQCPQLSFIGENVSVPKLPPTQSMLSLKQHYNSLVFYFSKLLAWIFHMMPPRNPSDGVTGPVSLDPAVFGTRYCGSTSRSSFGVPMVSSFKPSHPSLLVNTNSGLVDKVYQDKVYGVTCRAGRR